MIRLIIGRFAAAAVVAIVVIVVVVGSSRITGAVPAEPRPAPSSAAARATAKYTGLSAPASVLYDAARDRYLVSNVNGDPVAKDDNGFISELSPDGKVSALKWIESGRRAAHLDAPKGLAIAGRTLFVADISQVRRFDVESGTPRGSIAVPGSTFLSALTAAPDGRIYVSDAGPPTGRWDGRGTEAVYVIKNDRAKRLTRQEDLGRPEGVTWTDDGLVVCPFANGEIYQLDAKGERRKVTRVPAAGLAGIVAVGDSLWVASWQASAVFRGRLGGRFEVALANQKAPADLGYDSKRGRLLIPHFTDNTVDAFELK
jgi:YD repeat-containing protein